MKMNDEAAARALRNKIATLIRKHVELMPLDGRDYPLEWDAQTADEIVAEVERQRAAQLAPETADTIWQGMKDAGPVALEAGTSHHERQRAAALPADVAEHLNNLRIAANDLEEAHYEPGLAKGVREAAAHLVALEGEKSMGWKAYDAEHKNWHIERERAEKAEARVRELEGALSRLVDTFDRADLKYTAKPLSEMLDQKHGLEDALTFARAALGSAPRTEGET